MKLFEGNNCSENVFIMNINEFQDKAVTTQRPLSQKYSGHARLQIGMNQKKNFYIFNRR